MELNITEESTRLGEMTLKQLQGRYADVFGEACGSKHKEYLIKRILWRIQAMVLGQLSQRAMTRAKELANDADLRLTPPKNGKVSQKAVMRVRGKISQSFDHRVPPPGEFITRKYNDKVITVLVCEDGFEYDGRKYKSLSAIARKVTGSHWNGYRFFKLDSTFSKSKDER